MKLLVFAGSTRQESYNRKLAKVVAQLARDTGAEVTHIELADFDVPMYNADLEAQGTPSAVMKLKQIAYEHPAWIICTPEYNASYPALLKNTLDWISSPVRSDPVWNDDFRATRGKVVGMLSASPGALGGLRSQSHLAPLLLNLHCWVSPRSFALNVKTVIDQVLWAAARLQSA
jgi:chromate reductase